jgi:hypothetical protein
MWSTVSGPGAVTFTNPAQAATNASFSVAGTYVLQLTASDGTLGASDSMTVTVAAAATTGGGAFSGDFAGSGTGYGTGGLLGLTFALMNLLRLRRRD